MKTRKVIRPAGLFLLALAMIGGSAIAEEVEFGIPSPTVISSSEGGAVRYLAAPPVGFPDTTMVIGQAILTLMASVQSEDSVTYASIKAYPISTPWSVDNVTWDTPWNSPGGDIDDVNYAAYAMGRPGTQVIEIDLTDLCMRWADGRLPYYGFLIEIGEATMAPVEFLNGSDGNGPFATLRIQYTTADLE